MGQELISEKEWAVADYLALFEPGSPDHALLVERAAKLKGITVRTLRDAGGTLFEDTIFVEQSGHSWTVRARL